MAVVELIQLPSYLCVHVMWGQPCVCSGHVVVQEHCILNGHRPELGVSHVRPVDGTVKEQRATDFGDGSDGTLGNCIVVMTAGACQLMDLTKVGQLFHELMRGEGSTLVGNIALWSDA